MGKSIIDGIEALLKAGAKAAPKAVDEAARQARGKKHFPIEAYHGTRSDFPEFERGDLGFHFGSAEQANNRLANTRKNATIENGDPYGEQIMPVRLSIRNPLEMTDVGQWNDPLKVVAELRAGPARTKFTPQQLEELRGIRNEAIDLRGQFESGQDYVDDMATQSLMRDIRNIIMDAGYDGVKYRNQVENAFGHEGGLTPRAENLMRKIEAEKKGRAKQVLSRGPQPPDPKTATEDDVSRFLSQPRPKPTPEEQARFDALNRRAEIVRQSGRNDPHSYIAFEPQQVRSRHAQFDPAKLDSGDLLAGIGAGGAAVLSADPEHFDKGGIAKRTMQAIRNSLAAPNVKTAKALPDTVDEVLDAIERGAPGTRAQWDEAVKRTRATGNEHGFYTTDPDASGNRIGQIFEGHPSGMLGDFTDYSIKFEKPGATGLAFDLHTHPQGAAFPSKGDFLVSGMVADGSARKNVRGANAFPVYSGIAAANPSRAGRYLSLATPDLAPHELRLNTLQSVRRTLDAADDKAGLFQPSKELRGYIKRNSGAPKEDLARILATDMPEMYAPIATDRLLARAGLGHVVYDSPPNVSAANFAINPTVTIPGSTTGAREEVLQNIDALIRDRLGKADGGTPARELPADTLERLRKTYKTPGTAFTSEDYRQATAMVNTKPDTRPKFGDGGTMTEAEYENYRNRALGSRAVRLPDLVNVEKVRPWQERLREDATSTARTMGDIVGAIAQDAYDDPVAFGAGFVPFGSTALETYREGAPSAGTVALDTAFAGMPFAGRVAKAAAPVVKRAALPAVVGAGVAATPSDAQAAPKRAIATIADEAKKAFKPMGARVGNANREITGLYPKGMATPDEISEAAKSSGDLTYAKLGQLYKDLGLTGYEPSSIAADSLRAPSKSVIDAAIAMKLADQAMIAKAGSEPIKIGGKEMSPREALFLDRHPTLRLPSYESRTDEGARIAREVKKAEGAVEKEVPVGSSVLYDVGEGLNKRPDVPQFDLPRSSPEASDRLSRLDTLGAKRLAGYVDQGEGRVGGWYNLDQLRNDYRQAFGPKEGDERFRLWTQLNAGTSMTNPIENNIRTASWYQKQMAAGEPLPMGLSVKDPDTGRTVRTLAGAPPAPYGAKAQVQHAERVRDFLGGEIDPVNNPKPFSYAQNLGGNWAPVTADTHYIRDIVGPSRYGLFGENSSLNPREYSYLESLGKGVAADKGLDPAAMQARAWTGGGKDTGLKSEPIPYMEALQKRILITSKITGLPPDVVREQLVRGKVSLFASGGRAPEKSTLERLEEMLA